MPLHHLCGNREVDETAALEILKLLIEKCPEAIRHADNDNAFLPVHIASMQRSPEFCRVLIEAYPKSERISNGIGALPLHCACLTNTLAAIEYLYKLYPDAINNAATNGCYPIRIAIMGINRRNNPTAAVEIVEYLLNCDPGVKFLKVDGRSLLHFACGMDYNDSNVAAAIGVINLLHAACPDFVREEDDDGRLPLHHLCKNTDIDEAAAIEILKLLIEKCPEAIRHADNDNGFLPVHIASMQRSRKFYHVLIEAYPGSERITDQERMLPFHWSCGYSTLAMVEYLYKLYPDAINHATTVGFYPIHLAIMFLRHRESPIAAVEIVKFLLDCDSKMASLEVAGVSLLRLACKREYGSKVDAALKVIKAIFDTHPEAIEHSRISSDILGYQQQVRVFINSQLVYSR
eukprot:scaffold9286_cov79-Skeletonema_dohrnii-CCMP3373.AAC.2